MSEEREQIEQLREALKDDLVTEQMVETGQAAARSTATGGFWPSVMILSVPPVFLHRPREGKGRDGT
jgi:hypothetical protein